MHVDLSLPPGTDVEHVREVCLTACGQIVADLPGLRTSGTFAHWTDATMDFVATVLPFLVTGYIAQLGGDDSYLESASKLIRRFGADRARTGLSSESFLRIAIWTRSDLIRLLLDAIDDQLDAETRLSLSLGFGAFTDALMIENQAGYAEELIALTAEQEGSSAQILRATQAGLALGDRNGNVVYVNDAFSRYLGKRDAELLGNPWSAVLSFPDFDTMLEEAAEDKEVWRDVPCTDEFGTVRMLRISLRVVRGRVHAVAVDVTGQVEFEKMRRDFVRGLIHDLRSPLTLISGWANTLLLSNDRLDDDTRRKALETIVKAARQVRGLTENILELDLLEGKPHPFETQEFDALEHLQSLLPRNERTSVSVEASGPVTIETDGEAFERIITNLVDNALAHGVQPVTVTVSDGGSGEIRVSVEDQGTIERELAEQAFRGRVPSTKGFGIGLRATRLLTEALGGRIELVSSHPTTFAFWLPVRPVRPDDDSGGDGGAQ